MNCFDGYVIFLLEQHTKALIDISYLKQIQRQIFDWWLKNKSQDFTWKEWGNVIALFAPIKRQAYETLLKFHQNELMIAKLTQYHYISNQQRLKERLRSEIRDMYPWLREFLKAMILSRIGGDIYEHGDDSVIQRIFNLNEFDKHCMQQSTRYKGEDSWYTDGVHTTPWKSMYTAYSLLQNASSLSEKIQAVSLALNASHDNGRLFDQWLGVYTEEEFNQLSSINEREVDKQLNTLLGHNVSTTIY